MAAARHRAELVAAAGCLDAQQVAAASRRRDGLYSHPARPGRYVQDLIKPLRPGRALTANTENYVAQRVGLARNYGVVIFDAIARTVGDVDADQPLRECFDACEPWQAPKLREWRVAAGFFPTRPPDAWDQPPIPDANAEAPNRQLALRLADGGADPASVEQPHDLLW
ncbi:MAG TPA: hypothetical protein VM677_15505, partial [Actinokineospora sp.]|nr:hypothetical protein [Actinokineospora sp.]